MPAIPNAVRRGAIYYWRRRVPARLAKSKRSATLLLGLRTSDPRRARVLAAEITALADLCFFPAVMNLRLSQQQLQSIFRETFTRHLDKLEAVVARERMERNFDAEENRRSDRMRAGSTACSKPAGMGERRRALARLDAGRRHE